MTEFGPQPPRKLPKQDQKILELQMDQWIRAREGMRDWAYTARECVDFAENRSYTAAEEAKLDAAGIPPLKLNKIGPLVRLMRGFYRDNKYEIRYLAGADGTGSDETADVLTALSKHIDTDNRTRYQDAEIFDDGIVGGRGYCDIRLDFSRNVLGEVRERALDPHSVYPDPEADSYDTDDWNFVHVSRWASLDDIQIRYGQRAADEVEDQAAGGMSVANSDDGQLGFEISPVRFFGGIDPFGDGFDKFSVGSMSIAASDFVNRPRKLVRLVETQHRKLTKVRRFIDITSGQTRQIPRNWKDDRIKRVLEWAQAHNEQLIVDETMVKSIRWTVSAGTVLLYDEWSPYRSFTVVPYFPEFRRGHTRGMVEDLRDPQREVNVRRSAMLQIIRTTANSGWVFEENSLTEEMKEGLENGGGRPGINIEYNEGRQAPVRIEPGQVPQQMVAAEQAAAADLKEIAGINEAAMGQMDKVMSGRAVEARQRSAYLGAELYFDNFARYQEKKGRVRLEIVQDYYTEPRLFRVPNAAGQDQQLMINWKNAADELMNDVNSGTYHVTVDSAPVSATFLQGAMQEAIELKGLGINIPPDVMLDLSSIPMKQRIKDGLQNQPPAPPPAEQMIAQAAMTRAQNEPQIAKMKTDAQLQESQLDNETKQHIADQRVALDTHLEHAALESRERVETAKLAAAQTPALSALHSITPGMHIAEQLQHVADQALAGGNHGAAVSALVAEDKIVNPLPAGAKLSASVQSLPRPE